jgi:hypothetical protein
MNQPWRERISLYCLHLTHSLYAYCPFPLCIEDFLVSTSPYFVNVSTDSKFSSLLPDLLEEVHLPVHHIHHLSYYPMYHIQQIMLLIMYLVLDLNIPLQITGPLRVESLK